MELVKMSCDIANDKANDVIIAEVQLGVIQDIFTEMNHRRISPAQFSEWIERHLTGGLN